MCQGLGRSNTSETLISILGHGKGDQAIRLNHMELLVFYHFDIKNDSFIGFLRNTELTNPAQDWSIPSNSFNSFYKHKVYFIEKIIAVDKNNYLDPDNQEVWENSQHFESFHYSCGEKALFKKSSNFKLT